MLQGHQPCQLCYVSLTINLIIYGFISDVCQKVAVVEAIKGGQVGYIYQAPSIISNLLISTGGMFNGYTFTRSKVYYVISFLDGGDYIC